MSFSKFSTPTPATCIRDCRLHMPREIQRVETRLKHGYTRSTEAFCIKDGDSNASYWLLQIFDTPNNKDQMKTANALLWRVLTNSQVESFTSSPELYSMEGNRVMSIITCTVAIDELFLYPKCLAACLYTTNSFGALSSFSLTHDQEDPACLEYYFNVVAKSELSRRQIASIPGTEVVEYMRTTRFMTADALLDIVEDLSYDDRFVARAPRNLSDAETKAFNNELLLKTRANLPEPEVFKALVLRWIERNKSFSKIENPACYKEWVGRTLPLPNVAKWNESVGLLMIVIASYLYKKSPVDLQLALAAGHGALVAEFTPKDERYGITVDKMDLDEACKTPRGKIALMKLLETEHDRQENFIADLKAILEAPGNDELAKARAALVKLTQGIDQYGRSIHGLSRAILLRYITGDLKFPPLLFAEIEAYLAGIGLNWKLKKIDVDFSDDDFLDPFCLCHGAGERLHMQEEIPAVGLKRSLSE